MKMSDTETDINDAFDTILLAEDRIVNEAFREGFDKGKKQGELDGYHTGYHRGAELGAEIGFYKGVVDGILSNVELREKCNVRTISDLTRLRTLLDNFPKTNNHDVDMQIELDNLRALYRKVCSVMRLNLTYPTTSKMSF